MLFWLTLTFISLWLLVIYHHIIYPLILRCIIIQRRLSHSFKVEVDHYHTICILVPSYNEEDVIEDKINNISILDYPRHKLQLIVACDGCTDNTAERARAAARRPENAGLDISIIEFKHNKGKTAILNQLIPTIDAEIIALSDASALISYDALLLSNAHFQTADIGVVAATYKLLNPGSNGEKKYWDYQVNIKRGEASIGSPIGVHGALYFFRRTLFKPMPSDIINDDFYLPMRIVCNGYRAVYDCNLVAVELEESNLSMDQKRRVRIAAGNIQQLIRLPMLLSPKLKGTAFNFISGKAMRALMPIVLLSQLIVAAILCNYSDLFQVILIFQILGIIIARLCLLIPETYLSRNKLLNLFRIGSYIINGYYSALIGTLRYFLGLERGHWRSVSK